MKRAVLQILLFTLVSYYGYAQNSPPQIAEIEIIEFNTSVNYGGGSGITIHFNPKGVYKFENSNGDNKFFLELSDSSGNFSTNPEILATVNAFFTTAINAKLPNDASGNYKLRIRASKGLTGFTNGQPDYGEVLSPETTSFTINSSDNYSQSPVTGYSTLGPNNSLFNCTDQDQFANETMFGSVTASTRNTASDILPSTTDKFIKISSPDPNLTYSIKRINVFNNTIVDLGTITNTNPHIINGNLPLGTYNYEIQAIDNGIASVYSVILVLHRNATTISNSSSNQICVGNEFLVNVDTKASGIGENFYGSYYTVNFGDGSPVEYYTHAELMLSEEDNQISYQYNDVSCGALGNDNLNFDFKLSLFNKFNTGSNSTCTYQENGGGVSKEVNTSLPPEASFTTDDICQDESLIVTNTTSLGKYGIGSGTQGCLDAAEFEWEIQKPDGTTQTVLVDSDGVTQIGPSSWVTNVNTGKPDLEIPASAITAGCWGIRLKTLNDDLCQASSFFPSENSFYTVNVQADPQADFSITDQNGQDVTEICFGQSLQFTDTSNITNIDCQTPTHTWDISPNSGYTFVNPDDRTTQNPKIVFNESGDYTITQTISNECGQNSKSKDITILGDPTVEFNPSTFSVCETIDELNTDGYTLDFNDPEIKPVYSDPPFEPSSYNWTVSGNNYTFINGTSSTDPYPVIKFDSFGNYNVSVQVDGQCSGSNNSQLNFNYKQTPEITNTNLAQTLCSGETTEEVIFNSNLPNTSYSIAITADNAIQGYDNTQNAGTVLPEMTLTNLSDSPASLTYTVTPTSNGCEGEPVDFTFTVNPLPQINNKTAEICSGDTFNISPANGIAGDILPVGTTYTWTVASNPDVGGESSVSTPQTEISQQLTNTSNASENIIYDVTPVSGEGCEGAPFTITVTVNPEPVVNDQTISVCSDSTLDVDFGSSTSIAVETYNITSLQLNGLSVSGGNAQVGGGFDPADLSDDSFINITNAPVQVIYTVIPVSDDGCEGDPFTVTATVGPEPVVMDQTKTICSNELVDLTLGDDTNGPSVDTYNLTKISSPGLTGGSSNVATQNGLTDSAIINDTWENLSGNDLDVVYTFVPVANNGCEGDAFTVTVTVNPEPEGIASTPQVCSDSSFSFDPQENINNGNSIESDFTWEITSINGTVSGATVGDTGTNEITGTLVNTTDALATVGYEVIPISTTSGCQGAPFDITVTVNPKPVVNNQTVGVCSDSPLGINFNPSNNGSTYNITDLQLNGLTVSGGNARVGGGFDVADLADDSFTNITNAPVQVIYTVVPVSSSGCQGDPFTVTATVGPEPVVINQTKTVCSNETVGVTLGDDTNDPSVDTYNLTKISSAGLTGGSNNVAAQNGLTDNAIINDTWENLSGNDLNVVYTFIPVADNGCKGETFTVTVTVNPEPVGVDSNETVSSNVGFNFDPQENINNGGNGIISDFAWEVTDITGTLSGANVGDTGTSNITGTLVNTTNAIASVVYEVTPTSTSGCEGAPFTITASVNPEPVVSDQALSVCSDSPLTENFNPSGSNTSTTYNVTDLQLNGLNVSGGNARVENGFDAADLSDDSFTNITNAPVDVIYTVIPVSSEGVEGSAFTVTATINPEPEVIDQTKTVCSNELVNVTLGNDTNGPSVDTYNLTKISSAGLTGGSSNVTIQNGLDSSAIINDSWENLSGNNVDVIYTFIPVANNGCKGDTFTATVTVNPEPVGVDSNETASSNVGFNFDPQENINNGGNGIISDFAWEVTDITGTLSGANIGDTGTSNITGTLVNTTNAIASVVYEVTPTSTSGCEGAPFTITASVNPEPVVSDQALSVCSDSTLDVDFKSSTSIAAGTYDIIDLQLNGLSISGGNAQIGGGFDAADLSDDSFTNITNAPVDVIYTVIPVSSEGVEGSAFTVTATINPEPEVIDQTKTICSNELVNVTLGNDTNGPDVDTYNLTKVSSAGLTGGSSNVTIQNGLDSNAIINDSWENLIGNDVDVIYTFIPMANNGCEGDTFTVTVTVNSEPEGIASTPEVCSSSSFSFDPQENINNGGNGMLSNFTWEVTDINGTISGASIGDTGTDEVTGTLVNTTDAVATVLYKVTPTSTASGCEGAHFTITATVNPNASLEPIQDQTICSQSSFNDVFLNSPTQPTSQIQYEWEVTSAGSNLSGYTQSSGLDNIPSPISGEIIANASNSAENLEYTVTPYIGNCPGTPQTFTITILPTPEVLDASQSICSNETFSFIPTNGGGLNGNDIVPNNTSYTWLVENNPNVTGESNQAIAQDEISQSLVNATNTSQDVVYTITPLSSDGCEGNSFDLTVTVEPEPVINNKAVGTCSGESFVVSPSDNIPQEIVPANTLYTWTILPGQSNLSDLTGYSDQTTRVSEISQNITNLSDETKTITYEVTPESGACIGEAFQIEVNINPKPIIKNLTASPICSEDTFSVSPQNGVPNENIIVPAGTTYTWTVEDNPNITGESDQIIEQNEISQSLVNTSSETQTLIYTVIPNSDGCEGDPFEITVEINPSPFIPSGPDLQDTQCSGDPFVISPQDGVPTSATIVPEDTKYTWVVSKPNSDLTGWSDQTTPVQLISQSLTNTTNQIQQITYTVTPEANGCIGPDFDAVVTIEPKPFVSDVIVDICDSSSYVLSPQNGIEPNDQTIIPEITKYSWSSPDVTGGVTGGSVGNDEDFFDSGVLNNPTNDIQTVTYTVTPKYFTTSNPSTAQCIGDEFTVTITVGPSPDVNAEISNISCSYSDPLCGGSIEISPEGVEPFTYNWTSTNGNISNPSNKDQFNLCPGEYRLEITDSFGCTYTYDYTIEPPSPVSFDLISSVDLSCNNVPPDCDGYIEVDLSGGTEPYTALEWYTESVADSGNFDTLIETGSDTITNACEGNYVLKVLDSNGCEFVSPVYNIEETGSPITINDNISNYNGYNVSCFNSNDGFIEVDVSGGSGSFTYSLSPGNIPDSDPSTPNLLEFDNLAAGDYTLTVNDDNCPADITLDYNLEAPSQITTSHELISDPAACFGDTTTYNVSASGGVPPYTGTGNYKLNAGEEHEIVITDANGCSSTEFITIPEPEELTADASITESVACFGETATVEITANGGTPPYSGTGEFNVDGGDFVFTVTDANDCTYSNSIFIPEPDELVYNIESVNNPTCSPDRSYSNGSICISITGGTNPFPIGNGWTETEDGIWCLEGLTSGTYLVDVTDDNGCLSDNEPTEINLTRPEPLDAFITTDVNADCSSNVITQTNYVFVSGGTPPYEISWSGGDQCDPINEQCMQTSEPGVYTAFIHDQESLSNNCPPVEVDVTVDLPDIGNASFNYSSPNSDLCNVLSFDEPVIFNSESTGDVVNLSWDFGDGSAKVEGDPNPSHIYDTAGNYQVELTVEYAYGCTKTYSEILEITKGYDIVLPNAFTPNGDGMNDTIRPVTLCFKDVKMSVYDTFGSLIYIESGSNDTLTGWDGTIDGKPAENGNYIIVVEATTYAGETIKLNGPVTLIK